MIYLFYKLIKLVYDYLSNKKIRLFYKFSTLFYVHKNCKYIQFDGMKMNIIDLNSFRWQYEEIFLREIYSFSQNSKTKSIIIDCGTNIGMSLLYFSNLFPDSEIYGFEADPLIFNLCNKNLIKNKIKNVKLINKAVWKNNNGIKFYSDGNDGGRINTTSINENTKEHEMSSIRLHDFLLSFEKIDFLKIDIEGAEYDVLLDCKDILSHIDNIFIEYHCDFSSQKLNIILDILSNNNFSYHIENLTYLNKPFVEKNNSNSKFDMQLNIFAKKYV
jgi:FkbM family methyltransferase